MTRSAAGFGFVLALISLQAICICAAYSSSGALSASVNVICPFTITPNALAEYTWGSSIVLNYSAQASVPCTAPGIGGYFGFYYASNSVLAYKEGISLSGVTYNSATDGNVVFETTYVQPGNYIASFNLTAYGETVSANEPVQLLNAAAISITGASIASPVTQGSPISIFANFSNIGQLASGNFTFYVNITGPSTNALLIYTLPGLSPGGMENLTVSVPGYSQAAGTYSYKAYAVYGNNTHTSIANGTYVVNVPASTTSSSGPPPAANLSSIMIVSPAQTQILYAPVYTSLTQGSSALAPIVLQNVGSVVEDVNLSIPSAYSSMATLSTGKLVIPPGQSLSATVDFSPPAGTAPGVYVIPVNIIVLQDGNVVDPERLVFYVYNNTNPFTGVTSQITLLDNGNIAQGTVRATAYAGIENATLETLLPTSIAPSESDISSYGIPSNITEQNGYYVIKWYVGNLSAASSAVAYYEILDPNPALLGLPIQNMLTVSSAVSPTQLLMPINFALPEFYSNSTNQLDIDALYTGTTPQDVYFYLTGPPGVPIVNSSRVVLAQPNQLLTPKFSVLTNSTTGTMIFYAYVITAGANITYTLPIRVVTRNGQLSPLPVSPSGSALSALKSDYTYAGAALLVIIVLVIAFRGRGRRGARYDKERANRLVMMRERIKREMDQHG